MYVIFILKLITHALQDFLTETVNKGIMAFLIVTK